MMMTDFLVILAACLVVSYLSWSGATIDTETIEWGQTVCEPNDGLVRVGRHKAVCVNGAEFTI